MKFPLTVGAWPGWVQAAVVIGSTAVILYGGLGPLPTGASEPCVPKSTGYLWQQPIDYRVGPGLKSEDVQAAVRTWESVSLRFRQHPEAESVFQTATLPGGIVGAVSKMRLDWKTPTLFEISVDLKQAGFVPIKTVLVHEIGHILGLFHTKCPNSVMYPTLFEHKGLEPGDIIARNEMYPIDRSYLPATYR